MFSPIILAFGQQESRITKSIENSEEKKRETPCHLFCFVLSDYLVIQESLQGPGFVELGFYRGNTIDFLFDDFI